MLPNFKLYKKADILKLTRLRKFETKLGERIDCASQDNIEKSLAITKSKYIVIGIPEDIGVRANYGTGGTETAWDSFLSSFLNLQSNDFLDGDDIFLAGCFNFSMIKNLINTNAPDEEEKIEAYRHAVNGIDEEVEELIKLITSLKKIPVVIGGGHNNAYPIIKGTAKGLYKCGDIKEAVINCINLDAHTDYRPVEGRHSGNAFRYAHEEGYLKKYCMLGVHENYLQQNVLHDIQQDVNLDLITYETIFLEEKLNFQQAMNHAITFCGDSITGLELDLDSISGVLSSGKTPSGITSLEARQCVQFIASRTETAYLHISEGAARLDSGESYSDIGKLITYLVTDFIKANKSFSSKPGKTTLAIE
jgi:formiminoglutamase